jgi:hypothetical protein
MATKSHRSIPALSSIGIDIGKDVFHLVGFETNGEIVLRRKVKRLALVTSSLSAPLRSASSWLAGVTR